MPERHKKRGRLYLNDGSCIRLRPCWKNHVWAYDFVFGRLMDGTKIRFLTVVDEYTRECLAIRVGYNLKSDDVMDVLTDLFIARGSPWENGYNESFNGKFRKEFLDMEALTTLQEPKVLTEQWRHAYNHIRPYISLGYKAASTAGASPAGLSPQRGENLPTLRSGTLSPRSIPSGKYLLRVDS